MKIIRQTGDSVTYECTYTEALRFCYTDEDVRYLRGLIQLHDYPPLESNMVMDALFNYQLHTRDLPWSGLTLGKNIGPIDKRYI